MKILMLGAGASVPFYTTKLTTPHLTSIISNGKKWEEIVKKYTSKMGEGVSEVNAKVVVSTLNEIRNKYKDYNFEQIIEIIDKISSFEEDTPSDFKIFSNILNYLEVKKIDFYFNHCWQSVPFLFRQLISEEIAYLHSECKIENYQELTLLQEQFVHSISNDDEINIFTLNYDEIILDAIKNLNFEIGFKEKEGFNVQNFLKAKKTISFPHGHSRFSCDNETILFHKNSNAANNHRLDNLKSGKTTLLIDNPYAYSFNTFIATGQQKEPTFNLNPYAIYYQKFASDCLKANKIYIVGYSFADLHFNRMLRNFLTISPQNQIIIVDFIRGDIDIPKEYSGADQNSLIFKIFLHLNIHSLPVLINGDDIRYKYGKAQNDLNQKGYAEIYPQITLYKKGYDAFLKEFAIINL